MVYEITVDSFQGPLDLLLYLIEKDQVDIYDIPISQITDQYIRYIKDWNELNLDVASEFLVMAATLLEIKSKVLLPQKEEINDQIIEEEDPRQELIEKLIEYKKYKNISLYFKDKEKNEEKIIYKDPEYFREFEEINEKIDIDLNLLCRSFKDILIKQDFANNENQRYHEIEIDTYTVQKKMEDIIYKMNQCNSIQFSILFQKCNSKNECIMVFLALLELIKLNKVIVNQNSLFEDFVIFKSQ